MRKWHAEELALFQGQAENVSPENGWVHPLQWCLINYLSLQPFSVAFETRQRATQSHTPSSYVLEHNREYGLSDDELAYLAGSMFGAGFDSVSVAIALGPVDCTAEMTTCCRRYRSLLPLASRSWSPPRTRPTRRACKPIWTVIGCERRKRPGVVCFFMRDLTRIALVPAFGGEHSLPYLKDFMMEVYRWRSINIASQ
jgi:hypothetical protein